jgi:uncharacterized protein (TIGR00156 family)
LLGEYGGKNDQTQRLSTPFRPASKSWIYSCALTDELNINNYYVLLFLPKLALQEVFKNGKHKEKMKIAATFLAGILLLAGATFAQTAGGYKGGSAPGATGSGGFTGPSTVVTVKQAKSMKDDEKVTLRGTIESHIGGDKYIFKDASGTIEIEIDDRRWAGQTISATDRVEIFGEIDTDWNSVEIDVKRIRKF